jgi:hypothetical protein
MEKTTSNSQGLSWRDSMKNVLVIDLDDTLFKVGRTTRFFFNLSKKIYRIGFRFEKLNHEMLEVIRQHDASIILSARADDWMRDITLTQLEKHRITANKIILCPRNDLYMNWKKEIIKDLQKAYKDLIWIDNDAKR